MAGLAGGLFAGLRGTIGAPDFQLLASLPLLLLAVVCGVTSVTGAALGGVALMLLPVLQSYQPGLAGLMFAVIGFGAVALGRDPNGLANLLFALGRALGRRVAPSWQSWVDRTATIHAPAHVPGPRVGPGGREPADREEVPRHAAVGG
jgi:branched-chain amino acid transport system permease protein